jgi:hypothetical protein
VTQADVALAPPATYERPSTASTAALSLPETPYKGLAYYSEQDAAFFFGRERDTKVVTANIMASRLTLLYGESGVGKSSLLRAGVARHLRDLALDDIARRGKPQLVAALVPSDDDDAEGRITWRDDPLEGIAESVERAVRSLGLEIEPPKRGARLDELLIAWTERLEANVVVILDQFEEYLLYHEGEDGDGTLATELPRALARTDLRAGFLISIREDSLAKLDRFKKRIPTLFDNYLRVSHLDRSSARDAIRKPIDKYNELSKLAGGGPQYSIEEPLIDKLLDQLRAGEVVLGVVGVGASKPQNFDGPAERQIETPYLQLVMTRLWKEELANHSTELRLATLERLGGSDRIVKTHLDETMRKPSRYSRYVAATVFHHLVTPSGTKIAHSPADLAAYVGLAEADVEPVLEQLTGGEYRILRRVASRDGDGSLTRYEIFHDVLAAPILDWRARYLRAREALQSVRRVATALLQVFIGLAWILFALTAPRGREGAVEALFVFWAAGALVMWVSATVVLLRLRRRRTAWVVPLVGVVASALAPVTVAIASVSGVLRVWTAATARAVAGDGPAEPVRAPRERATSDRVRQFSAFVALLGAGTLVAACFLPLAEYYGTEDRVITLDYRLWFALEPIAVVVVIALTAILLLFRATNRALSSGLLAALGLAALGWFVNEIGWAQPTLSLDASEEEVSPRIGAYVGAVGGGLVLVAAAPASVLAIFAAIVGAGRMLGDATRAQFRLPSADASRRRIVRIVASVLALAGALLSLVAYVTPFADSFALSDGQPWSAFRGLLPGVVAGIVALLMLLRPPPARVSAGLLMGSAVAGLAYYGGVLGIVLTDDYLESVGPAGYLGLAGSASMFAAAIVAARAKGRPSRTTERSGGARVRSEPTAALHQP